MNNYINIKQYAQGSWIDFSYEWVKQVLCYYHNKSIQDRYSEIDYRELDLVVGMVSIR